MKLTIEGDPKEIAALLRGAGERLDDGASPSEDLRKRVEAMETMLDAARAALKPKFVGEMCTGGAVTKSTGPNVWGTV